MNRELKRLVIIAMLMLAAAVGLLAPLRKLAPPERPKSVPSSAVFVRGDRARNLWIDCQRTADHPFSCNIYLSPDGTLLMKGTFRQAAVRIPGSIYYDGASIHWKEGALLQPVQLTCVLGGRPDVADCRTTKTQPDRF